MSFSVVTNPDNSSQMTPPNNYPGFFQEQSNQNQPHSNNQQSAQNAQANKTNLANLAAMAASKATTSKMPDNVIRGDSGSFHSYSTEQKVAFAEFVNIALTGDPDLADDLPINVNDDSLFEVIKKGIVLPKLINLIEPNCVKNITIKKNMNNFEILTNHTATLKAAKELGCSIVNIGESDIMEKKYHLVLGLIWQILDKVLLKKVSLKYHPEILAMLKDNDNLETFIKEDPQEKLMRWVNYQLTNENSNRRIKNFREDLSDGIVYLDLIRHISPKDAKDKINEFMNNNHQRIQKLRDSPRPSNQLNAYPNNENSGSANKDAENNADPFCIELINFILNVSRVYLKVFGFVTASSIIAKNDTMNITFISSLFHHYPCLGLNQDKVRVESIIRNKLKDLSESPESIGKMIEQFESNCLIQQHNEPIPLFQFNPNNAIHVRPNASGNVPPPDVDKITPKLEEPPSKNTNNVYSVNREELTLPVEKKPNVFDCPDLQQYNFQANYQNMNPGDGNFYNNNNNNNYQNCDYANGRDNFYMNNNNNNNNQYGNTYGNQYDNNNNNNNNNNNPYQSQYGPQNGDPNSYNTNFQNNFSNPYQNPYYNPYSGGNYPLLNTNQGNLNQFTPQYGNNYTQSNIYCNPPPWTQTQTTISTVYMAPPPPQQIVSTSVVQLIPDEVVYIVEDLN